MIGGDFCARMGKEGRNEEAWDRRRQGRDKIINNRGFIRVSRRNRGLYTYNE